MTDYPTDDELQRISAWPFNDPLGWVDFVVDAWWASDQLVTWTQRRLYLSTGGWGDNEDIVGAMRANFVLWSVGFVSHRRGGHYVFDLTRLRSVDGRRKTARPKTAAKPVAEIVPQDETSGVSALFGACPDSHPEGGQGLSGAGDTVDG